MTVRMVFESAAEDSPYTSSSRYSPHSFEHIRLYLSETVGVCRMSNNVGLAYHKLFACATKQQLTRRLQPVLITFLNVVAPRLDRSHSILLSQRKSTRARANFHNLGRK